MSYGHIGSFPVETNCQKGVSIALKITGTIALLFVSVFIIVGGIYGVKIYNKITPAIDDIINNANDLTVLFNQAIVNANNYALNITQTISEMESGVNEFTEDGLKYVESMANNLQKIARRIGGFHGKVPNYLRS